MNRNNHGGARAGAGRKKGIPNSKPRAKKVNPEKKRTVCLNDELWEKFKNEGGATTLRKMIADGKFKKY